MPKASRDTSPRTFGKEDMNAQIRSEQPLRRPLLAISIIVGAIAALIFVLPTFAAYSATPSDPQKAVGYIFISLYGLATGALGGFSAAAFYQAFGRRVDRLVCARWLAVGIVTATAFAGLFISKFQDV